MLNKFHDSYDSLITSIYNKTTNLLPKSPQSNDYLNCPFANQVSKMPGHCKMF